MTHKEDLKNKVRDIVEEEGEYLINGATGFIRDGVSELEEGLENAAEQVEEAIHDALTPRRRIPWLGIAAGIGLVAGVIYLSRHRAQRQMLQKTVTKGIQGGAVLALALPGGLRKARESADHVVSESARFLERLGEKIPVKIVMK